MWCVWVITVACIVIASPFSLTFAGLQAMIAIFILIPAATVVTTGQTTIAGQDYEAGTLQALQMTLNAQVALLIGWICARTFAVDRLTKKPVRISHRVSQRSLEWTASKMFAIGVSGLVLFSAASGASLRQFFVYTTSEGYGSFYRSATGTKIGYLQALELTAGVGLILLVLAWTTGNARSRSRWIRIGLTLAISVFLLASGQRARFVVPAIACGLVWIKTTRSRVGGGRIIAVMAIAALLLVSILVGAARDVTSGAAVAGGRKGSTIDSFLRGSDLFTPLAGLAVTVTPSRAFLDGRSYLELAIFPLPRALWEDKPTGEIAALTATFDPYGSGLAFPEFGELYANFGHTGVTLGMIAFGWLLEVLWLRFSRTEDLKSSVALSVAMAVVLQLFTRGAAAPVLGGMLGLFVGTYAITRRRSRLLKDETRHVPAVRSFA